MIKKSLYLILLLFFFSCTTTSFEKNISQEKDNLQNVKDISSFEASWQKLTDYSQIVSIYLEKEKTFCHLIKIDLSNPTFKINSFPKKNEKITTPRKFSKSENCDIVFNTLPYTQKIPLLSKKNILGIYQFQDELISVPNQKYCALEFYQHNKRIFAQIYSSQSDIQYFTKPDDSEIICIHGGFWQILQEGKLLNFKDIKDSRTAIGLSQDNRYFFILSVEGEKKSKSKGLSYKQCALLLKNIGAYNAMEFDGGSSSCLYINGKNKLNYRKNPYLPSFLGFSSK